MAVALTHGKRERVLDENDHSPRKINKEVPTLSAA
jgi:hypothetical protein